jgi:hypothetical protein
MNNENTKNIGQKVDKENRRIGIRMFKKPIISITNINSLKQENDSFINSKPGRKLNMNDTQKIFGSQIVIE